MEAKDAAKALYLQGWPQNRIASILKVTEKTIGTWKESGKWEKKRTEMALAEETASERVWKLINHNLKVLENRIDDQDDKLIDRGDIDGLCKLFSSIKGKQLTWTGYVVTFREFCDWLQTQNLELSKQLLEPVDIFLQQKRKDLA